MILLSICLCLILSISGCITDQKELSLHDDLDLSTVALSLSDFNESYELIDREHIKEPYVVQEGLVFEGWRILEKFEASFRTNEYTFIVHEIAKLPSTINASIFVDEIRNQDLGYDFEPYLEEELGDNTYIAFSQSTVFDRESTLYLIGFNIDNIIVVLVSSFHSYETTFLYAQLLEERITNMM